MRYSSAKEEIKPGEGVWSWHGKMGRREGDDIVGVGGGDGASKGAAGNSYSIPSKETCVLVFLNPMHFEIDLTFCRRPSHCVPSFVEVYFPTASPSGLASKHYNFPTILFLAPSYPSHLYSPLSSPPSSILFHQNRSPRSSSTHHLKCASASNSHPLSSPSSSSPHTSLHLSPKQTS